MSNHDHSSPVSFQQVEICSIIAYIKSHFPTDDKFTKLNCKVKLNNSFIPEFNVRDSDIMSIFSLEP